MKILSIPALALMSLVLTTSPSHAEKDWEDCESNDPERVIRGCKQILSRGESESPKDRAIAHSNRGVAYSNKGLFSRAIEDYDKAISLDPNFANAYNNRGLAYDNKGLFDRAIEDYDKAIKLDPDLAVAYSNRGLTHEKQGRFDRAITDYNKALNLNPKLKYAYNNRGYLFSVQGKYALAKNDLNEAIRLYPEYPNPRRIRGEVFLKLGRLDEALRDLSKAIELDGKYIKAYQTRAKVYEKKGDYDKAIRDYTKALSIDLDDSVPLHKKNQAAVRKELDQLKAKLARKNTKVVVAERPSKSETPPQNESPLKTEPSSDDQIALVAPPTRNPVVAPSPPEKTKVDHRVALVIGNSSYKAHRLLKNPANDAKAIAAALKRIGFQHVKTITDQSFADMRRAIRDFGDKAANADVALVYFAGHGMELGGHNYLIPIDANLKRDRDLEFEAVKLNLVLHAVDAAKKLRIVLLDACRDNPFARQMAMSGRLTRSVSRGFSRIEPTGNTLVVYAAKDGTTADDGASQNSPFTTALLQHLETPGLEINFLFRRVRDSVLKATRGDQEPFVYGSLSADAIYLNAKKN